MNRSSNSAFTLVELLICLLILGVISSFTIPKVINAQNNQMNKSRAKEAFSVIAASYQLYKMDNNPSSMNIKDLAPYINYIKMDTTSALDGCLNDSNASYSCTNRVCLKLHSGATIAFGIIGSFGGTTPLNMQWFLFDPDGTFKGDYSSIWGALYYTGRVTSWGQLEPNSKDGGGTFNPGNYDPTWFSW